MRMSVALPLALAVSLMSCKNKPDTTDTSDPGTSDTDTSDTDTSDTDTSDTDTSDTDTTTPAANFADDIRPLLAGSCARCHGESGLGPLNFLDYDTASAWAEVMIARIDAGEMPPPSADPTCHPYRNQDSMALDPALRPALAQWIDDGKPMGDLDNAAPLELWEPLQLTRRDRELRPPAPVEPQYVNGNEYRCFLIDADIAEDTYITGIEPLIDNAVISHHAVLFIDPSGGSEARITDPASQSWVCDSVQPEFDWQTIHAWAPSGEAIEFPEGLGLPLRAGQQLVMQMHYWEGTTETIADLPGYALKLEDEVDEEMIYLPVGPDSFRIPAGEPAHTETLNVPMAFLTGGAFNFDVYGLMPHMHVLGDAYDVYTRPPGGGDEVCISRSDAYDFAMQPTYWFDEPVRIGSNDTLTVSCTYDNSASNPRQLNDPPQDVYWGEDTQQEMCYALMYAVARP